jgi:GDPmannose 4,6-dehydratase
LLDKGYRVYGLVRRPKVEAATWRLDYLGVADQVELIGGNLLDYDSLVRAVRESQPDEVYNLAAISFPGESMKQPLMSSEVTATGAVRVLEAVRQEKPHAAYFQASSSGLFGPDQPTPRRETDRFDPRNPYHICKLHAHLITKAYRDFHDMFACNGILFNHESPLRGLEFVTRKITDAVARIKVGLLEEIRLGNIATRRDFGFAGDYVECMWMMLQQEEPDDYVIATGEAREIREFVDLAFGYVGLNWEQYVKTDNGLFRPDEIAVIHGNPAKAVRKLGWNPHKTSLDKLAAMMVEADLKRVGQMADCG